MNKGKVMEGRQNESFFDELYRKTRHWAKGVLESVKTPTWIHCPESLQIDTLNYCSCSCEYCNVKNGGSFNIPRGKMPTEMVKYVIDYWGKFKEMKIIAPFVNGEPMLDERLFDICEYTTNHSHAFNLIDTNGTPYENRHLLLHPNLKLVRFTISANTPETYEKVHGRKLFDKALETFWWFDKNRLEHQNIVLHFIVTKNNEHEIEDWLERFDGFLRKVFPLHRMPGIQLNSEESLGLRKEFVQSTNSVKEWEITRPLLVFPNGKRKRDIVPKYQTCQGMSFAVMWDGTILHCTDAPPIYNYGKIPEVDMLEAWNKRNQSRRTNPACIACNAKRPDWETVLDKWIKHEV